MKSYLGEFEELVLLAMATLGEDSYGVSIKESIKGRCGREISIGVLHSGKRYFDVTNEGRQAVAFVKVWRDELWSASKINLSLSK